MCCRNGPGQASCCQKVLGVMLVRAGKQFCCFQQQPHSPDWLLPVPGETTFAQMPDSALQPTEITGCGQGREGGKERWNGWEKGTKGPVVSDAHKQLPQLLRDKGQSSISSFCGSKRNHVLDVRRLAAGSLILGPATCSCSGLTQNCL